LFLVFTLNLGSVPDLLSILRASRIDSRAFKFHRSLNKLRHNIRYSILSTSTESFYASACEEKNLASIVSTMLPAINSKA